MKQALKTIGFMVLIATVFGAGVTGIRLNTRAILERNRNLAFQRAVVNVFGLAAGIDDPDYAKLYQERVTREELVDPETQQPITCYTAYADAAKQQPEAVGFEFTGRGFWAPISGIMALNLDRTKTIGLTILEQQETPGLGGRVAEGEFTDQFRQGIVASPDPKGRPLRVSSTPPAADSPNAGRHVDTITGATQTSMAMDRMLNEALVAYDRAYQAAKQGGHANELR